MATAPMTDVEIPPATLDRRWRIVGGLSMNLALGSLYAWSVFVAPFGERFGWKRTDVAPAFTIAIATFALSFVLAGRLQDRFGPLVVSLIGGPLASAGYFACGSVTTLPGLYLWFGLVIGLGNGFGYATPIPVMAKWFPDRRGLAVGLAVAGYGGGSALTGLLCSNVLIPRFGLAATFRTLGLLFLAMTTVGALLLRSPPPGYRPKGWNPAESTAGARATAYEFKPVEMIRTRAFPLLWLAYAFGASAGLMVISQLVPFATSKGIRPDRASLALLVGAAGNVAGRTLSGWSSDAIGRLNVLRITLLVSAVAMPLLDRSGGTVVGLYATVFVVYWCFGTLLSVNASTSADFWGMRHAGLNYGLLYTAYGVAGVIGPLIGSALHDRTGSYRSAFEAAGGLAALALAAELIARRPDPPATRPGPAA